MLPILAFAFILSGAAGLIYESVWTRYLGLIVGHSAYAQILVLVIFLGGMSLGAWAISRRSDRIRDPLLGYIVIEVAAGLLGAIFHVAFVWITGIAYEQWFPALAAGPAATTVKWTLAALLILPQSILLGATFPLMTAGAIRAVGRPAGHVLGLLYFANSLGAAAGVLIEGFVLLPWVGLPGALATAAALNLLVAVIVLMARRDLATDEAASDTTPVVPVAIATSPVPAAPGRLLQILLGVSFLTAFSSFMYEVGWIRMLSLVLGSATHSFELMLSAFILGLALGAWWIRGRIDRDPRPLRTLALVQWAMGLLAIATLPVYLASFDWTAALIATLDTTDEGYRAFSVVRYGFALAVMLPATFCAGMTLPLITGVLVATRTGERAIGLVYAINTIGSIIGAALAGLVLLPWLGLKAMLIAAAAIDIGVGVALILWDRRLHPGVEPTGRAARLVSRGSTLTGALIGTAGAVLAVALLARFDRGLLTSGVYRYGRVPPANAYEFLHYEDGRTATVSLRRTLGDTNSLMTLGTNGKPDASIGAQWRRPHRITDPQVALGSDMATQVLLSVITLAHAPRATTAAVIGHGSGMTSHLLLGSPHLRDLYTIEIEPEMIRASRAFQPANRRVYEDPRSHFVVDDARSFLSASGRRFDLILSEPSNPWVSGVSGLFTVEFYQRVRDRLAPGGVFGQWLHLYEISDELVTTVLASVAAVFPAYEVFLTSDGDMLIVASPGQAVPVPDWSVTSYAGLAEDLARVIPARAEQYDALRIGSKALFAPYLEITDEINSDFAPRLDLGTERARYRRQYATGYRELAQQRLDLGAALSGQRRGFGEAVATPFAELARNRGLARATLVRTSIGVVDDPRLRTDPDGRAAVYRVTRFRLGLTAATPPADWASWVGEFLAVESDLHMGTAGVADEMFYLGAQLYLLRVDAPAEVRAAVQFMHGLAAWDFAQTASVTRTLVEARPRGESWIPTSLLRQGGTLAYLMSGDVEAAERLLTLTASSEQPLGDALMASHVVMARRRAEGATPR